MLAKQYLLLLSSALFLQCALADVPKEEIESSTVPIPTSPIPLESLNDLPENTFFDHLRLLIIVVEDFLPITSLSLSTFSQHLTNAMNALLYNTDDKNEQLIKKIKEVTDVVAELDAFLTTDTISSISCIELFEKLVNKLDSFHAAALDNPSDEDLLIDAKLRDNDVELMEQRVAQFYDTYLKELRRKYDVIEKELPSKELAADEGLKTWMAKTKDLIYKLGSIVDILNAHILTSQTEE